MEKLQHGLPKDLLPVSQAPHHLPAPFSHADLRLITQGAEALVYQTTFLTPQTPVAIKYRPPKPYRHAVLDKRLTRQRLLAEARSLVRVKRGGVHVPGVIGVDWDAGWLVLEWVEGRTIRRVLDEWTEQVDKRQKRARDSTRTLEEERQQEEEGEGEGEEDNDGDDDDDILDVMRRVGQEVGKLHALGVCHGDLTTSNLMLQKPEPSRVLQKSAIVSPSPPPPPTGQQPASAIADHDDSRSGPDAGVSHDVSMQSLHGRVFLIDFGLTTASLQDEDKAVDLYVLERAFSATHPAAEHLFQAVLRAYGESYKGGKRVLKRLEGVRLRGRKRSMLG